MSLTLDGAELQRLHAHAVEGYPHEVVGLLAGDRAENHVQRVHPLVNERADAAHNRYKVSGLTLMRAERALEAEGLEILGYYHSHPDHPARYSDFDREHALPNMSYLITAVHEGRVVDTLSWRLVEDRTSMDAEDIQIRENPMAEATSVTIHIPTPLRAYTEAQASVVVEASTVGGALRALTGRYPSLSKHLRSEDGRLRSFVNVYLGEEDIRFLDREDTAVDPGAVLTIVPSIAGGAS